MKSPYSTVHPFPDLPPPSLECFSHFIRAQILSELFSQRLSFTPNRSHRTPSTCTSSHPQRLVVPCGIFPYNFAFSPTSPIFSFGEYFFNTDSLWYFQNCSRAHAQSQQQVRHYCNLEKGIPLRERHRAYERETLTAGVLARDALQDLGTARVLVNELGHVVDAAVHDDVHALLGRGVGRDLGYGDCFGHLDLGCGVAVRGSG